MNSASVTLERYAEIRAEMEIGRFRDDVLKRAGIAIDEWTAVQREWLEKMGGELERGKFELTNRYTQVFLERQRVLKANEKRDAAPVIETRAPVPMVSLPVVEPLLLSAVLPQIAPIMMPSLSSSPPVVISTPFAQSSSPGGDISLSLEGTLDIDDGMAVGALARQILPFQPSAPPALPAAKEKASRIAPKERAAETGTLDIEEVQALAAPQVPVIPFAGAAVPIAAKPLDETMDIGVLLASGVLPAVSLPFDPAAPPHPEMIMIKEKPAPTALDAAAQLGTTLDISAILQAGNSIARPMPFDTPKPDKSLPVPSQLATTTELPNPAPIPETPALTLERYASLCVEYARAPAQAREIAARYALTDEQWASVDAYWRGKMAREPAVRVAWEKACVTYREWLLRR